MVVIVSIGDSLVTCIISWPCRMQGLYQTSTCKWCWRSTIHTTGSSNQPTLWPANSHPTQTRPSKDNLYCWEQQQCSATLPHTKSIRDVAGNWETSCRDFHLWTVSLWKIVHPFKNPWGSEYLWNRSHNEAVHPWCLVRYYCTGMRWFCSRISRYRRHRQRWSKWDRIEMQFFSSGVDYADQFHTNLQLHQSPKKIWPRSNEVREK